MKWFRRRHEDRQPDPAVLDHAERRLDAVSARGEHLATSLGERLARNQFAETVAQTYRGRTTT